MQVDEMAKKASEPECPPCAVEERAEKWKVAREGGLLVVSRGAHFASPEAVPPISRPHCRLCAPPAVHIGADQLKRYLSRE